MIFGFGWSLCLGLHLHFAFGVRFDAHWLVPDCIAHAPPSLPRPSTPLPPKVSGVINVPDQQPQSLAKSREFFGHRHVLDMPEFPTDTKVGLGQGSAGPIMAC